MKVLSLIGILSPASILLLALAVVGCGETGDLAAGGADGCASGELDVSPAGPIELGYFQEQAFEVALVDAYGQPLAGEPISVSLIGPAHNGYITPFELTSDESGQGSVVFTAPDTETHLEIRFSSPAAAEDVVVDIEVDPAELGLVVEVSYDGLRDLELVEAAIYRDFTCEDLALGAAGEPSQTQSADSIPAAFEFVGLHAGSVYAVSGVGRNGDHQVRAAACVDGLLPDGPGAELTLADIALDVVGVFEVTTVVDTAGLLEPVVDELAVSLDPFSADVPGAILDGIREVIADEPLVAESFDAIRVNEDLDGALADDFAAREVDVPGSLAATWSAVDDRLAEVSLAAEFEIGAPSDGIHDLYHTIGFLSFDEMDASFLVSVPETGQATAQSSAGDVDLLVISQHQVGLGLGGPIQFLLESELALLYGAEALAEALETVIDCDAVVTVLADPLSEVADAAEILAGCQGAMLGAEALLDDGVALVNAAHGQVSFDTGSCRLTDPGDSDLVEALVDGAFEVTWEGAAPLGPMVAQFEGQLQD